MTGLLLISLSFLYISASLSPAETSAADSLQKPDSPDKRLNGKGQSDIKHSTNFARGIPHSGYAGGSTHGGGEGATNGGESGSSSPKSGAAVIPIYAGAGANNNHHRSVHHGAGGCIRSHARAHALITALLALCCVFI